MCDEHTLSTEMRSRRALSRRDFNLMAFSAAAVAMLPGSAIAGEIKTSMVDIETPDGIADAYFARPAEGRHPGVLMWPDFMTLRPAYKMLARRLAQAGYAVLVVNQYYRGAKSPIFEKADFDNKVLLDKVFALARQVKADHVSADARAFLAFLDRQPGVDTGRRIGTLGYCISGSYAFLTAAAVPDRVGALASFHGGGLVSDKPTSPHLLIQGIRAQALIAIAEDDDQREPETKTALRAAFADADVAAEVKVYPGTLHGWCTPDMSAYYNEAQAQQAWADLLALFDRTLAQS